MKLVPNVGSAAIAIFLPLSQTLQGNQHFALPSGSIYILQPLNQYSLQGRLLLSFPPSLHLLPLLLSPRPYLRHPDNISQSDVFSPQCWDCTSIQSMMGLASDICFTPCGWCLGLTGCGNVVGRARGETEEVGRCDRFAFKASSLVLRR